jgi:hypothetical protein
MDSNRFCHIDSGVTSCFWYCGYFYPYTKRHIIFILFIINIVHILIILVFINSFFFLILNILYTCE